MLHRIRLAGVLAVSLIGLSACMSPLSLEHTVAAYDETITDLLGRQLLTNVARARHHQPIHFTAVSTIAATFNFQLNLGATPALTGNSGGMLMPLFGGSASENPTISIIPIEGEEFTKRLLAPIQESKLTMLLRQGADVDLVLRLMADAFREEQAGEDAVYYNRPADPGYARFRRIALHLSSIQDRKHLHVEPLFFKQHWEFSEDRVTPENLADLRQEFSVEHDPVRRVYRLAKRVTGRVVVTNYDPDQLSNEERIRLHEDAEGNPPDEVIVDIRAGRPGGEYPLRGRFRLRSFNNVLNFLGRGMAEEPEYDVAADPRTPDVSENPARTLCLAESKGEPSAVDLSVEYRDRHYAVCPDSGYPWNREAFRLLYQLFQMTVTELPQLGIPGVTIAK